MKVVLVTDVVAITKPGTPKSRVDEEYAQRSDPEGGGLGGFFYTLMPRGRGGPQNHLGRFNSSSVCLKGSDMSIKVNVIVNVIDENGNLIEHYQVPTMENSKQKEDDGLAYLITPIRNLNAKSENGYLEVTFKADSDSEHYDAWVARSRRLSLECYKKEEDERKA